MTTQEFRDVLKSRVKAIGTQAEAAKHYGVSSSYLSEVIRGTREPAEKLLSAMGIVKVVRYEEEQPPETPTE